MFTHNLLSIDRYSEGSRPWIPFHCDAHAVTVNVALVDDASFEGGELLGVFGGAIRKVERKQGEATVHNSSLLHAVTKVRGKHVRYSLILFFEQLHTDDASVLTDVLLLQVRTMLFGGFCRCSCCCSCSSCLLTDVLLLQPLFLTGGLGVPAQPEELQTLAAFVHAGLRSAARNGSPRLPDAAVLLPPHLRIALLTASEWHVLPRDHYDCFGFNIWSPAMCAQVIMRVLAERLPAPAPRLPAPAQRLTLFLFQPPAMCAQMSVQIFGDLAMRHAWLRRRDPQGQAGSVAGPGWISFASFSE